MPADRFGIEEIISDVDSDAIRFCPIHRLPHSPDSRIYAGAGRTCPAGGEPLIGVLARWRGQNPDDDYPYPDWFGEGVGW